MIRRLADTACAAAGTEAVVKMYGRARCTSHSITVPCATTNAPDTPAALPSVPMEIRFGDRTAALRTEHAETVRIVDDQPCSMPLRKFEKTRQRRDVAVHAEHRIG